jgi:DNA-directed RNA polymerase specialized sigma24 family protein
MMPGQNRTGYARPFSAALYELPRRALNLSILEARPRRVKLSGHRSWDELCLFRRYFAIVSGISRRILRDEVEAQDLVQDVFLYIYRKCRVYNPAKRTASSWIVQTIYYQALQRRMILTARQHQSTPEVENGGAEALPSASILTKNDHSAERVFGKSKWREILKTLTEDQWDTLRLALQARVFSFVQTSP